MFEIFISGKGLVDLINIDQVYIIDIRSKTQFEDGHIAGAYNIDYDLICEKIIINSIADAKTKSKEVIVIYCDYGESSYDIAKKFRTVAYNIKSEINIRSLYGGYNNFYDKYKKYENLIDAK